MKDLPSTKCEEPHLLYWAENPVSQIEDTYDIECIFPDDPEWEGRKWSFVMPFEYDKRWKEFHLVYADKGGEKKIAMVRNCPCCGGEFPKSERDAQFGNIDTDYEMELRKTAWKARTNEEIMKIYGEPDLSLGPVRITIPIASAYQGIKSIIVYTRIHEKVVVLFKEFEAGFVIPNFAGKWMGNSDGPLTQKGN